MGLSGASNYAAIFRLEIRDKYTARVKRMQKATAAFRTNLYQAGKHTDKLATKLSKMGSKLANLRTGFAAAMLTMGLKAMTNDAFEFSDAMNAVKKNVQGTAAEVAILGMQAKALNAETKYTAIQAAETMAFLGQAGLGPKQIGTLMPDILAMATAGRMTPESSAELLSGALSSYNEGLDKAVEYTDILSFVSTKSKSSMLDLVGAVKNAGGMAGAVGIDIKDTAAVLGILAEKMEKGSSAGTRLSMAFTKIIEAAGKNPQKKVVETLTRLGIDRAEIFKGKSTIFKEGGLIRFFELLDEKGATANDILDIFTIKSGRMLVKMLGMSGDLRKLRNEMDDTGITTRKMADVMMEGLAGATYEADSAWKNMRTSIGESISFITIPLLKLKKATSNYIKSSPKLAASIGILMGVAAALLYVVTITGVVLGSLSAILLLFGKIAIGPLFMAFAGGGMATGIKLIAAASWSALSPLLIIVGTLIAVAVAIRSINKLSKLHEINKENIQQWHKGGYRRVGMSWMKESYKVGGAKDDQLGWSGSYNVMPRMSEAARRLWDSGYKDREPVKVEFNGQIDINDKTGAATIPQGGGNIPMNIRGR